MRFDISDGAVVGSKVGCTAKALLFPEYPNFQVRIAFSTARTRGMLGSKYACPDHPFFNSFFGIYEVEFPVTAGHAFGFTADGSLAIEEIVKLALADWGLFSAQLHGAPSAAIERELKRDPEIDEVSTSWPSPDQPNRQPPWVSLELRAYLPTPCTGFGVSPPNRTVFLPSWRATLGTSSPLKTRVDRLRVHSIGCARFVKVGSSYRTMMVGGAISARTVDDDPSVAERFRIACERVMERLPRVRKEERIQIPAR